MWCSSRWTWMKNENAKTAEFCGIEVMPTFQFFKGSVKVHVDELVGASEQALKDKIEFNSSNFFFLFFITQVSLSGNSKLSTASTSCKSKS
jgi:hypothetical protein